MPVRPLGQPRGPLRVIRPSPVQPANVRPRPLLFRPRMPGRAPMGFRSIGFGTSVFGSGGFGSSRPGISRGSMMPAGGMPPRRKILVNPHFRGSSSMTMVRGGPAPAMSPASAYPKLIRDEVPRQPQQQPRQFMVNLLDCYSTLYTLIIIMPKQHTHA